MLIRAQNTVGLQAAPVFGEGHRFRSAFRDDGQVVNIMIIPTTSVVILIWSLPQLALSSDVTIDFFEITHFDQRDAERSMKMENVSYNPSSLDQPGFSTDLSARGGGPHTINVTAVYSTPHLISSPATVSSVRVLEEGK